MACGCALAGAKRKSSKRKTTARKSLRGLGALPKGAKCASEKTISKRVYAGVHKIAGHGSCVCATVKPVKACAKWKTAAGKALVKKVVAKKLHAKVAAAATKAVAKKAPAKRKKSTRAKA